MRYLSDTDYLIDASGGMSSAMLTLGRLADAGIAVSIISLGEMFEGAYSVSEPARVIAEYRMFLATYAVIPLSDPIMVVFGGLRVRLRRSGLLIPDFDLLIASTAIHHGLTLITRNRRHFARLPELTLYLPSEWWLPAGNDAESRGGSSGLGAGIPAAHELFAGSADQLGRWQLPE